MAKKAVVGAAVCGVFGVVVLAVGLALIPILHNLTVKEIDNASCVVIFTKLYPDLGGTAVQFNKDIPIKEGSATYDIWKNPSVAAPIYFQIWVFDLQNPEEILNEGAQPVVVQKGPYTYKESRKKVNITFHDNGTVSYRELKFFVFDRNQSFGPENDTFTTVNLPMLTLANFLRFEFDVILRLLQALFSTVGESLFIELSVRDILWGYEDNLLKEAKKLLANLNITINLDDKFGLFYKKNGSDDGEYTIYTGESDINKFNMIDSWKGMSSLPFWSTSSSNMINGTDGTMYPPFVDKSDVLYIFASDICRSIYGTYTGDTSIFGIDLLHFVPPESVFASPDDNPANTGFCVPADNCDLYSGVLNISVCSAEAAPVIMSEPHFNEGSPKYVNAIDGMHPDPAQHRTFWDVEPTTGAVMNVAKKLQINVYVQSIREIIDTLKFKTPLVYPILWLNESGKITEKSANDFKDKVEYPMRLSEAIQYGVIVIGAFILLSVIIYFTCFFMKRKGITVTVNGHGPTEKSPLIST